MSSWLKTTLAWSQNSMTHLWANVVLIVAGLPEIIMDAVDLFGDPDIKAQFLGLIDPHWVSRASLLIAVVTKMARNRNVNPMGSPH